MDRRELLGVLGAGVAGLAAVGGGTARADHEGHEHDGHIKTIGDFEFGLNYYDTNLEGPRAADAVVFSVTIGG